MSAVLIALAAVVGAVLLLVVIGALRRRQARRSPPPCACSLTYEWRHEGMAIDVRSPAAPQRVGICDPVALAVSGADHHVLSFSCTCGHRCGESASDPCHQEIVVRCRVRYEWQVVSGRGRFVRVNQGDRSEQDHGEQVLFLPPELEHGERDQTRVRVSIEHDDPTKEPLHAGQSIEIVVTSRRTALTHVEVSVAGPPRRPLPLRLPQAPPGGCDCLPTFSWEPGAPPSGSIAAVPSDPFVAVGDRLRLEAAGQDLDHLVLQCLSGGHCLPADPVRLDIEDLVAFSWSATAGFFPAGAEGREVVWRAPSEPGRVTLSLSLRGTGGQAESELREVGQVEIEVCPLGVEVSPVPASWVPDARAGRVELSARTYRLEGDARSYPGRPRVLTARLVDVSREPGVCCNFPLDANTNPDLFFDAGDNSQWTLEDDGTVAGPPCPVTIVDDGDNPAHDGHWLTAIGRQPANEARLVVRCEDYGAIGKLVITAGDCEPNTISIPRDDNGNDIADAAPHDASRPDADDDARPGGTPGDGLTNYEEYRGFLVGGGSAGRAHVRTDPTVKDVFVHDEDGLGIGHFARSGLAVHVLRDPELYAGVERRVVNFNRGRHSGGEQHGIRLVREALAGQRGEAFGGPGRPGAIDRVAVDTTAIAHEGIPGMGDRVRAHILAHAVGVEHHGQGQKGGCGPSSEVTGLQSSGDINCVMRATWWVEAWCDPSGHRHAIPAPDVVGTDFCTSSEATGANVADGARNDASNGDCLGQITVRDW